MKIFTNSVQLIFKLSILKPAWNYIRLNQKYESNIMEPKLTRFYSDDLISNFIEQAKIRLDQGINTSNAQTAAVGASPNRLQSKKYLSTNSYYPWNRRSSHTCRSWNFFI